MNTPLYGLLLTGGKSSRMGEDKAQLIYRDDNPEWLRLSHLLDSICERTLLCHRSDQDFGVPSIIDPGTGPLSAIHTAQQAYPEVDWLVLACDLPLLEKACLTELLTEALPQYQIIAYRSRVDQAAEPLCTLYRKESAKPLAAAVSAGSFCPRELIAKLDHQLLDLSNPHSLDNANSPADALEVRSHLSNSRTQKNICVRYFAQLRELSKCDDENCTTSSVTASGLYEELKSRYHFPYKQKHLMLAINEDFADWASPLQEGDEVVFIPPVAGG